MTAFLDTDIQYLKGVGAARAKILSEELEISTFRDLLYYFPYRHVDRSRFYTIDEFSGEMPLLQVRGCFVRFTTAGEGARKRTVGIFSDGRMLMEVVWFAGGDRIREGLTPGAEYVIFGKPAYYSGRWSMPHPDITPYNPASPPSGFQGIYSLTDKARKRGITSKLLGKLASVLMSQPAFASVASALPAEVEREYRLMPFHEAVAALHNPERPETLRKATERMKFEELFYLQLHILRYSRRRNRSIRGYMFPRIGDKFNGYYFNCLPFSLTGAQKRVLKEIRNDMRTGRQMNRLLQGDVGSGKTMVAFMSLLMAIDNGCQGALMAPTEILATQHFETLTAWGNAIGVRVELLTGSTRAAKRREIHQALADGGIDILVGTHALIEDSVRFRRLGLAVIDEQHRFGVAQRARMWSKSEVPPHVLVMTATPIPRTLAMTVYGDLDVSVIDELPPGRKPIETLLRYDGMRTEVNRLIWRELQAGRQAYIVYPLIHDNPKLTLKSVEEGLERVRGIFAGVEVGCVHGRMKPVEKDREMERFANGETRILVATTVIEVGVNVPNASVMLIENAERFGLSQLHQLRGRVGRGSDHSYCILMTHAKIGGDTRKRLGIMTETSDGFLISEADMKLRGPGDMEGVQQSGLAFSLHIANLATDGQILTLAREAATRVLDACPALSELSGEMVTEHEPAMQLSESALVVIREELGRRFAKAVDWSRIS